MEIVKNIQGKQFEYTHVFGFFNDEEELPICDCCQEKLGKYYRHPSLKKEFADVTSLYLVEDNLPRNIMLVCLGKKDEYTIQKLVKILENIAPKIDEKAIIKVPSFGRHLPIETVLKKMVLMFDYYSYQYDECKSEKSKKSLSIYFSMDEDYSALIEEYYNLANAISNTRDLVNKPYNYLSAPELANYAELLASSLGDKVQCKVMNKAEIEALKMGAFLGVNKGSFDEPKLIEVTYTGNPTSKEYIGLVGKGIMYDTGGYSIKQSMNTMKDDMGGAATVLGVVEALASNNVVVNVKVVICATDNRIDSKALLPDDVLTSMNGKTIEIVSTDAEGRLTLADAITYIQRQGCKTIVDLATLTGAAVVALGEYTTAIFGNTPELTKTIIETGLEEDEHLWELPITDYIRKQVRQSKVADLTNSTGRNMGASGAAAFLEEFVEKDNRWVHLDIAGTAFHTSPAYQEFYGASGVLVKTLYQFLKTKSIDKK